MDYQRLFQSMPGLHLLLSSDFTILNATDAYLESTKTERARIVGKKVFEVFPDNPGSPLSKGTETLRSSLNRVLESKTRDPMGILKYDIRRPESEGGGFEERYWKPTNAPVLGSEGNVDFIIHTVEDVTDSVMIRELPPTELSKHEERFRLIVEAVKDYAIIMLSPNGVISSWNPGAERILGYTADEIVGQYFGKFYPSGDLDAGKDRRELEIARSNGRFEEEAFRVRKNGTQFWANVVVSPIYDSARRLTGFAKITRDLSERKKSEDALKNLARDLETQRSTLELVNKELESFSYSVSHDLRAPLRSMTGFSQALLEQYSASLEPQARDFLERISRAAKKMGELIDGLLNLSRLSRRELTKETVHLSTLVRNIGADLQKLHAPREVIFSVEDNLVVEGDPQLLQAAMNNLLENAWKFTKKSENPTIEFGKKQEGEKTVFFIKDNGAGFDMTYANKLFGAFQRLHSATDFEGTGIGLATVQRIIHRHGGKIWAESALNQGATFYFTL